MNTEQRQSGRTSTALRAFDELAARRRNAIYVVGNAGQRRDVARLIRTLGLTNISERKVVTVRQAHDRIRGLRLSDVTVDHAAFDIADTADIGRLITDLVVLSCIECGGNSWQSMT